MEPLRQGTGLQADAGEWQVEPDQESDQRFRLAGHLCLADDPTRGVHHAHAAVFQRHVDPSIMVHGCASMMLGADPLGPRSTPSLSEGQPPRQATADGRLITASNWPVNV